MCLNPKWIYKRGFYKSDNYRGKKGDFYELGTYSKCGVCPQCIAEKANNWVVRNYYEEQKHQEKCFVTLTYKKNPILLIKKDLQNFMKRLRRNITDIQGKKIRMFAVGEYGELNKRPHFHVIIYGWEDKNKKYLGINKKKNIYYKSETIDKAWGLGRTSYQNFNENEVPYISLYNTAREEAKKAYKINYENLKFLKKYALKQKNDYLMEKTNSMTKNQIENLENYIKECEKKLAKEKYKYVLCKEFNTWSLALGWEIFEKQYNENYVFTEYINGLEFATPSPWVKKEANRGSENAKNEMFRRQEEIIQSENEEEERRKNMAKIEKRRKKELETWLKTQKDKELL